MKIIKEIGSLMNRHPYATVYVTHLGCLVLGIYLGQERIIQLPVYKK